VKGAKGFWATHFLGHRFFGSNIFFGETNLLAKKKCWAQKFWNEKIVDNTICWANIFCGQFFLGNNFFCATFFWLNKFGQN
jgi:hypothetical protein